MIREWSRQLGDAVVENVGRAMGRAQERKPLPVDLLESEAAYLAVFDAPGATASDVQVRMQDGTVQVRIDRFRDFYEEFEMRYPGRGLALDGSVTLPDGAAVDVDAATATLQDNGTLEVKIPKVEPSSTIDVDEAVDDWGEPVETEEPSSGSDTEEGGDTDATEDEQPTAESDDEAGADTSDADADES
jgi:HSP20 family molecular chaperone IbpA